MTTYPRFVDSRLTVAISKAAPAAGAEGNEYERWPEGSR